MDASSSQFNYQRIKSDLLGPSSEEADSKKSRLLYALRQNLTNISIHSRRGVLHEYISSDILNIVSGKVIIVNSKHRIYLLKYYRNHPFKQKNRLVN